MRQAIAILGTIAALPAVADVPAGSSHDYFLDTTETAIGQPIIYPEGTARIQAAYGSLEPGQETGWHIHEYPIYIQILEGEMTVDYGDGVVRTFGPGESLVEVVNYPHNGKNLGDVTLRTIAVFIGAEGLEGTVHLD
ncbi:MAG: cupin domain-containing protein [Pseudomonadota bacterium]